MSDASDMEPMDWRSLSIEESGVSSGHCDCCGSTTHRVWGTISNNGVPLATYFVGWTEQGAEHGASFDLVLGKWGAAATAQDRFAVALDFRVFDGAGSFMVVDAEERLSSANKLAGSTLKRAEVVGTPLAPQVFALIDAIYMRETRLDELRSWGR